MILLLTSNIIYHFITVPLSPALSHYSPPENIKKHLGFLMFSGGIEKQQRAVMGYAI